MRRGLDIADCESATKIRGKYLRALEEEQFEVLPGPTYVRGFLRTYADQLELDGQAVLDEYERRFERVREASAFEEAVRRGRMRRRSRESRLLIATSVLALVGSVGVWVGIDGQRAKPKEAPNVVVTFASSGRQATYVEARQGDVGGPQLFTPGNITAATPVRVEVRPPIWVHVGEGSGLVITVDGRRIETPKGRADFKVLATGVVLANPTP